MKLSVIITNYNKVPLINYLINYFNRVKCEGVEIICIDDHSDVLPTDLGIVNLIVNETNKGIGLVRQQGLDISCGDYITFVDGDDIVTEDYLTTILEAIDSKMDVYEFSSISYPYGDSDYSGMVWNKVYSREFILKNNCRFEDLIGGEDMVFNEKFYSYHPRIARIDKILYIYNMMTDSMTHTGCL